MVDLKDDKKVQKKVKQDKLVSVNIEDFNDLPKKKKDKKTQKN